MYNDSSLVLLSILRHMGPFGDERQALDIGSQASIEALVKSPSHRLRQIKALRQDTNPLAIIRAGAIL